MAKEKRTPEQIIAELAPEYKSWKSSEKAKEKLRKEFFGAITDYLRETVEQAETIVEVVASNPEEATAIAEKENPLWLVQDLRQSADIADVYEVILEENPEFQAFTIEYEDETWGRQIISGSQLLDDDRMMKEDPDLYREITIYAGETLIRRIIAFTLGIEDPNSPEVYEPLEMYCEEVQDGKRTLRPLEDLDAETLAKVQEYMYEGKPSVRLPAPTKADG